ncbi:MAG: DUF1266 domain-containing protein [Treponema sp.]|jgi:hypothetical protein|nr:DUF1266 domain-containing protein [Treponema sp.]
MKRMVSFVITFLSITLNLVAESVNTPVTVEIINIPQKYNNNVCIAGIAGQGDNSPQVHHRLSGDIFSGEFKYQDESLWKIDEAERNARYQIILIINDLGGNDGMIKKFSRKCLIESDIIKLDYTTDFFDSVTESVNHYTPAANRLPINRIAESINIPIAVEIINIPKEFNGELCMVAVTGQEGLRVWHMLSGDIFGDEFKYEDGRLWKIGETERNVRYQVVLVIGESVTKFSRMFLIDSDVIKFDYTTDFFDSVMESLTQYVPPMEKLPENRLWALALTGFLTIANNGQHDLLGFDDINENNRNSYLELLRRDWSINNREELSEAIQRTENDGHAAALRFIKQIIQEIMDERSDFSIVTVFNKYHLSPRYYNYLKFTVINWNQFNNRTILAWDLGRTIALCRWGYIVGFLTEEEAWEKIMELAGRIQTTYRSWEEFGYDYYMGRVFWASGFGDDIDYLVKTDKLYKDLTGEDGYWKNFEWRADLNGVKR